MAKPPEKKDKKTRPPSGRATTPSADGERIAIAGYGNQFDSAALLLFDALADALTDLSWRAPAARTLVIGPLTAFYVSDPDGYETLIDVLADATEGWKETSTPLSVIELVPDGHGGPSV